MSTWKFKHKKMFFKKEIQGWTFSTDTGNRKSGCF